MSQSNKALISGRRSDPALRSPILPGSPTTLLRRVRGVKHGVCIHDRGRVGAGPHRPPPTTSDVNVFSAARPSGRERQRRRFRNRRHNPKLRVAARACADGPTTAPNRHASPRVALPHAAPRRRPPLCPLVVATHTPPLFPMPPSQQSHGQDCGGRAWQRAHAAASLVTSVRHQTGPDPPSCRRRLARPRGRRRHHRRVRVLAACALRHRRALAAAASLAVQACPPAPPPSLVVGTPSTRPATVASPLPPASCRHEGPSQSRRRQEPQTNRVLIVAHDWLPRHSLAASDRPRALMGHSRLRPRLAMARLHGSVVGPRRGIKGVGRCPRMPPPSSLSVVSYSLRLRHRAIRCRGRMCVRPRLPHGCGHRASCAGLLLASAVCVHTFYFVEFKLS